MIKETGWGALADEVMAIWPVTAVTVLDELCSYSSRRVLHLHSDQGDLAVRIDREAASPAAVERRLRVLDHLASRGYRHAPGLVRTSAGTRASSTSSRSMTLLEYVPGLFVAGDAGGVDGWRHLGRAAARLNGITHSELPFAVPVDGAVEELAARAAGTPFEKGVRSLLGRIGCLADLDEAGLVHGEINEANAGRRGDGDVVLLDWDEAGVGPVVLEYGYPLITAFVSEGLVVHHDSARAFYRATPTPEGRLTTTACSMPRSSTLFGTCGSAMSCDAGTHPPRAVAGGSPDVPYVRPPLMRLLPIAAHPLRRSRLTYLYVGSRAALATRIRDCGNGPRRAPESGLEGVWKTEAVLLARHC